MQGIQKSIRVYRQHAGLSWDRANMHANAQGVNSRPPTAGNLAKLVPRQDDHAHRPIFHDRSANWMGNANALQARQFPWLHLVCFVICGIAKLLWTDTILINTELKTKQVIAVKKKTTAPVAMASILLLIRSRVKEPP
ncbi:hypothetical protein PGB28_18600 [Primorskyibacter aestuariivivens]|uniref:hypothetical protein n=1 Tax=Primorskyibacter aestuariivivens TaxID=1888912 RepID=UPI0023002D3A|nr:hypothetical protein [Primorskyibacter aestuariivivens]MDA7430476.1 hypothetical protein [Primorskyibacter aestuariivivens]